MRPRRLTLAVCCLIFTSARAAGVVEDHTLSWRASGLEDVLATGHESALPRALFEAVSAAAPRVQKESSESFKFGKHNTWWLPLQDASGARPPPQSAIEAAVHALYDLDFGSAPTPIIGAEWWLQERAPTGDIGYHYDKDEAYASEHMTMRFPEVSTVTYLGNSGAPTLIFNQTTPDGNLEVPPLPIEGVLAYPHPNKHLVFRGNLQHGVSGALSIPTSDPGARRTLLINWWRYAPMPPNCIVFEPARWARLQLRLDAAAVAALRAAEARATTATTALAVPKRIEWSPLVVGGSRWQSARRVLVEVAPTDQLYFTFPPSDAMTAGNWLLAWGAGEAVGPLARMDLFHQQSLNAIFNDQRPKLFLVMPSRDWKAGGGGGKGSGTTWANSLPGWIHGLHATFGARLKFVLVEPREAVDFMKQFRLTVADAPTAAIHDTARGGAKYRLREKLRKATIWKLVKDFFAGQLEKDEL